MKIAVILFMFVSFWTRSQFELKAVFKSEKDSSLICYVLDTTNSHPNFPSIQALNIDSVLVDNFRLEYDWPYTKLFDSDELVACNCTFYLTESEVDKVLKSSKLTFIYLKYGYLTYPVSKELNDKYGIQVLNSGCRIDHVLDEYRAKVEMLLLRRNGKNWKENYLCDVEMYYQNGKN